MFPLPVDSKILQFIADAGLPTEDLGCAQNIQLFAHVEADEIAGVIGIEQYGQVGLLRSLAVNKKFQGLGIAKRLVKELEDHACGTGIGELFLLTTTAKDFFDKQGYSVAERAKAPPSISSSRQFSGLCPAVASFMAKKLSSDSTIDKGAQSSPSFQR